MPSPTPARFVVRDASWISGSVGWVLGGATCGAHSCISIKATTDGGRTWKQVSVPRAGSTPDDRTGECGPPGPCISQIRLASRSVGYAFGTDFYVTRDGGKTWRREKALLVLNLEISNGRAFRVVAPSTGCPGACDIRVQTAVVGSSTWRTVFVPRAGGASSGLQVEGDRVYVAAYGNPAGGAGDAHPKLWRSVDAGRSWRPFADPCGNDPGEENDAIDISAASGGFLAVLCQPRINQGSSFVVASGDSGRTFSSRRALTGTIAGRMAAGSNRELAVTGIRGTRQSVLVSLDGGRTWRVKFERPLPDGAFETWLGFANTRTVGVAFATPSLWISRDAGATWSRSDPF